MNRKQRFDKVKELFEQSKITPYEFAVLMEFAKTHEGEKGFSDVEFGDLLDVGMSINQVKGVCGSLAKKGFLEFEEQDVNGKSYVFIHPAGELYDVFYQD